MYCMLVRLTVSSLCSPSDVLHIPSNLFSSDHWKERVWPVRLALGDIDQVGAPSLTD